MSTTYKSHCYITLWCIVNHNTCFCFSDITISQGSVATRLRCDTVFYYRLTSNLLLSQSVKEI